MLVEDVGDRLDLFFRHGLLEPGGDRHDQEGQSADPNHRGQEMEPVIDDRDQGIEVGDDALECVHA